MAQAPEGANAGSFLHALRLAGDRRNRYDVVSVEGMLQPQEQSQAEDGEEGEGYCPVALRFFPSATASPEACRAGGSSGLAGLGTGFIKEMFLHQLKLLEICRN